MSETKTNPEVTKEVKSEGGDMKMKSKPKIKKFNATKEEPVKVDLAKDPNVKIEEPTKVDLTKTKEEDAIPIGETKEIPMDERAGDSKGVDGEVRVSDTTKDVQVQESESPIEEIQETEKSIIEPQTIVDEVSPKVTDLPDNIEKLVDFMKETGGTVQDYVRLNADYSDVNEDVLLKEYYKNTKPHLNSEEVDFIMEETFSYDTEVDEERDVKKRKLAKKEAVAEARSHLESLKQKYYDEIKLRPGVTQEQQKATEFFNRYNNEQEIAEQKHSKFINNTKQLFSNEFKGFDFEVGEKKFRYGVKDPGAVAENQSNLNNFVEKFLDKEGNVKDTRGYHKAMYAAQNIDRIVNHFYEQGKSDGIKTVVDGSKNPTTEARQTAGDIFVGGLKVRAIDGVDSSRLKIKQSKFNN
jgi:hypothetical protein